MRLHPQNATIRTIVLTSSETCGNNARLGLGGKTLTNKGTIDVENPHGGVREIEGSLQNEGTLSLDAGETLKVTGAYTQTSKGTFSVGVASSSSFGALSVTGAAKLGGALAVTDVAPFVGKAGESLAVLSSSSRTGTFSKETGAVVKSVPGHVVIPSRELDFVSTARDLRGAGSSRRLSAGSAGA